MLLAPPATLARGEGAGRGRGRGRAEQREGRWGRGGRAEEEGGRSDD